MNTTFQIVQDFSFYQDIRLGKSLVEIVRVPIHSGPHFVGAFDVNLVAEDSVAVVMAAVVVVAESPHSSAVVVFELEAVAVFLNRSVVVDWNSVLHGS